MGETHVRLFSEHLPKRQFAALLEPGSFPGAVFDLAVPFDNRRGSAAFFELTW